MKNIEQINRRSLLLGAGAAALGASVTSRVAAQAAWPSKPVKVVVPYAPGGGADTLARLHFGRVSEILRQPFIVDNRGGGAGTIGANVVAKAAPDGYTILHDATAFSVNPSLLPTLPYDSAKDFIPVFLAATVPNLLVVTPSVEARTVSDIIELAKKSDGLDWASSGNGTVQHLALELFRSLASIRLNHVPYKGGAPALNDLIGGHVRFMFSNAAASTPHVQAGKLKAIAHTGTGRLAAFPDLPAMSETVPGCVAYEWNGVFLPAGTPDAIVTRLNAVLNEVQRETAVADRLSALSVETRPNSPSDFASFLTNETQKWAKVVKDANVKPE